MSYQPRLLLHPKGQQFVSGEPPHTRRVCQTLVGSDGWNGLSGATVVDFVNRQSFTPVVPWNRYRFRIRNNNCLANTTQAGPYNLTGIYVGTPASSGLTTWNGVFASAPTSVSAATPATPIVIDSGGTGAEYVGPWITSPLPSQNQPFAVSLGFNAASALFNESLGSLNCFSWSATSLVAQSAQVGNTGVPTGGTPSNNNWLDVRIEYEFVGENPIGLYLGTSLTAGLMTLGGVYVFGNAGSDESWPQAVGLRLGHGISTSGVPGAVTATFTQGGGNVYSTNRAWSRFLDPTYPTLVWTGGCTPDYAVIDLGGNDANPAIGTVSLATFQANIAAIIAVLNALGIYRIFICTVPPLAPNTGFNSGALYAAVAASATTTIDVMQPGHNAQAAPAGGYPGAFGQWTATYGFWLGLPQLGNLNGSSSNTAPYPLTSAAAGAAGNAFSTILTVPSFTPGVAHQIGDPVLGGSEGYRQLYNQWMRQHVLGTLGTFDMAKVAEAPYGTAFLQTAAIGDVPGAGTAYAGGQQDVRLYGPAPNSHPQDPSLYEAMAASVVPQLIGI
jgi:hypothetical protein